MVCCIKRTLDQRFLYYFFRQWHAYADVGEGLGLKLQIMKGSSLFLVVFFLQLEASQNGRLSVTI